MFSKRTDDTVSKHESKSERVTVAPTAIDIAQSKIRKVLTATAPKAKESEFTDRHAVETGYIATEAVRYLAPAAKKVTAIKSSFSISLARNWGFYKRLNQLHAEDLGKIPAGKKDRVLNLHHAVDALAVALCSPKVIKRVVDLEKHLVEMRDPKLALKEIDPETFIPSNDADIREKLLRKQLAAFQPKPIANGLTGAIASIVVSHESKSRPRGKFFAEQPFGVSRKHAVAGEKPNFLNSRESITSLKASQIFPDVVNIIDDTNEDDPEAVRVARGKIASEVSRRRIADYCIASGFGPEKGAKAIEEFLKKCSDGITYEARSGTRRLSRVLTKVPCDVLMNYRVVSQPGKGLTLYPKLERHCALIVGEGKKANMYLIPLVDAAVAGFEEPKEYRAMIIGIASVLYKVPLAELSDALLLHKGDLVRVICKDAHDETGDQIYRVTAFEGIGRIHLRAHWSADTSMKKGSAVGLIRQMITKLKIEPIIVTPSGVVIRTE